MLFLFLDRGRPVKNRGVGRGPRSITGSTSTPRSQIFGLNITNYLLLNLLFYDNK
jgi:hypothetical protein